MLSRMRLVMIVSLVAASLAAALGCSLGGSSPPAQLVGQPFRVVGAPGLDRIFVLSTSGGPSGSGHIAVLASDTARLIRDTPLGPDPLDLVVDARTGRAFVIDAADNTLSTIDARSGTVLRVVPVAPVLQGGPVLAVDPRTHHVFVAGHPSLLLDAHTGRRIRALSPGDWLVVSSALSRVYLAGQRGVTILDSRSGRSLGTIPTKDFPRSLTVDESTGRAFVGGRARLAIADARTGRLIATRPNAAPGISTFVVDPTSGRLVGVDGTLHMLQAIDGSTGSVRYAFPVGTESSDPILDFRTGRVAIVDSGNRSVQIVDIQQGKPVLTIRLPYVPAAQLSIDSQRGVIYAYSRNALAGQGVLAPESQLSAIDMRTGRILAQHSLRTAVVALGVDEGVHRVLVVTGITFAPTGDPLGWLPAWIRTPLQRIVGAAPTRERVIPASVQTWPG